ncbi:MAG: CinA family protein [Pseudomonadales bacterium]|nr:CinA family protein [Pseudomonadales bacterium]
MSTEPFHTLAAQLGAALSARGWQVATAESCTGGGIASAITAIPGSSAWFECGIVSYSNEIKQQLLSVPVSYFAEEGGVGAVSEETVLAMAQGVLSLAGANCSVAVSGIAGPDGGSPAKPVGTVWIGWAWEREHQGQLIASKARKFHFEGTRQQVRAQSTEAALAGLVELVNTEQ